METGDKIKFWESEAKRSLEVAKDLTKLKRYLEALFFGHLALERLLKGKIISTTKKDPIYSHDLVKLAQSAKIKLTKEQILLLAKINTYNIRARYQDYKLSLFKQANKKYTTDEIREISKLFRELL